MEQRESCQAIEDKFETEVLRELAIDVFDYAGALSLRLEKTIRSTPVCVGPHSETDYAGYTGRVGRTALAWFSKPPLAEPAANNVLHYQPFADNLRFHISPSEPDDACKIRLTTAIKDEDLASFMKILWAKFKEGYGSESADPEIYAHTRALFREKIELNWPKFDKDKDGYVVPGGDELTCAASLGHKYKRNDETHLTHENRLRRLAGKVRGEEKPDDSRWKIRAGICVIK
ncbi:hypothetical protein L6R52_05955 [Myxococcota bacterium]|nr:hypothetical protein [Myxococcota bacterium]